MLASCPEASKSSNLSASSDQAHAKSIFSSLAFGVALFVGCADKNSRQNNANRAVAQVTSTSLNPEPQSLSVVANNSISLDQAQVELNNIALEIFGDRDQLEKRITAANLALTEADRNWVAQQISASFFSLADIGPVIFSPEYLRDLKINDGECGSNSFYQLLNSPFIPTTVKVDILVHKLLHTSQSEEDVINLSFFVAHELECALVDQRLANFIEQCRARQLFKNDEAIINLLASISIASLGNPIEFCSELAKSSQVSDSMRSIALFHLLEWPQALNQVKSIAQAILLGESSSQCLKDNAQILLAYTSDYTQEQRLINMLPYPVLKPAAIAGLAMMRSKEAANIIGQGKLYEDLEPSLQNSAASFMIECGKSEHVITGIKLLLKNDNENTNITCQVKHTDMLQNICSMLLNRVEYDRSNWNTPELINYLIDLYPSISEDGLTGDFLITITILSTTQNLMGDSEVCNNSKLTDLIHKFLEAEVQNLVANNADLRVQVLEELTGVKDHELVEGIQTDRIDISELLNSLLADKQAAVSTEYNEYVLPPTTAKQTAILLHKKFAELLANYHDNDECIDILYSIASTKDLAEQPTWHFLRKKYAYLFEELAKSPVIQLRLALAEVVVEGNISVKQRTELAQDCLNQALAILYPHANGLLDQELNQVVNNYLDMSFKLDPAVLLSTTIQFDGRHNRKLQRYFASDAGMSFYQDSIRPRLSDQVWAAKQFIGREDLLQYCNLISMAEKNGLVKAFRFTRPTIELLAQDSTSILQSSKVAVFLTTLADENGAFADIEWQILTFSQAGYKILFIDYNGESDLLAHCGRLSNLGRGWADVLIFSQHATPRSGLIGFSSLVDVLDDDNELSHNDVADLVGKFSFLKPEANVLLNGCSAAGITADNTPNLAETLFFCLPQVKALYAPQVPTDIFNFFEFDAEGHIKNVTFRVATTKLER